MKFRTSFFVLLIVVHFATISSLLSEEFQTFLRNKYGKAYADFVTRADLGVGGSFGGGNSPKTVKRPIIFVHGITEKAETMERLKKFFVAKGYAENELYASSYGPPGQTTWIDENGRVKCDYVQSIRLFIKAVLAYTKVAKVNVIAYSMGVVLTRKAILGGRCVETRTYLGGPLTKYVRNYIGIAGPNHGTILCEAVLPSRPKVCSHLNGMSCHSKYLDDINSKQHYEGEFVYVIQTVPDAIVGNKVCDSNFTSEIDGADQIITTYNLLHINVYYQTTREQFNLIQNNP